MPVSWAISCGWIWSTSICAIKPHVSSVSLWMPVEMEMTLDLLGKRLGGRNGVWISGGFIVTGMGLLKQCGCDPLPFHLDTGANLIISFFRSYRCTSSHARDLPSIIHTCCPRKQSLSPRLNQILTFSKMLPLFTLICTSSFPTSALSNALKIIQNGGDLEVLWAESWCMIFWISAFARNFANGNNFDSCE